jgi:hypothetical protein
MKTIHWSNFEKHGGDKKALGWGILALMFGIGLAIAIRLLSALDIGSLVK